MTASVRLSDEERLDRLRLIRSERIGPRTFRALLAQFGDAGEALRALPEVARRAGRGHLKIAGRAEALRELDGLARLGARLIAQGEPDYPKPLLAIESGPPLISVRGDVAALHRPIVAIVGSRNASAAGATFTERLAAELGRAGFVIASGLARGIDTRAHRASVPTGTVAVLAGGHDRIYPDENRPLLDRILGEGGAVVTEMPLGWEPRARDFPRRNRIVSGLSYGVVVVEAARRSGSLITARFALEQGREVFAVPGSPLDPRAEGTNDLIRGGATLCGSADHVIAALEPLLGSGFGDPPPGGTRQPGHDIDGTFRESGPAFWDELETSDAGSQDAGPGHDEQPEAGDGGERGRIEAMMSVTPVSVDDLARQAGLPVRTVHRILVDLEIEGRLERHGSTVGLAGKLA